MYIEIRRADDGSWYFVIRGQNNEVVATSEMYPARRVAVKTAESLMKQGIVEIKDENRDQGSGFRVQKRTRDCIS